jgi:hypothetical protein
MDQMYSVESERRSAGRLPDVVWRDTVRRVKGEFEEMPCLRVTKAQACVLFGLSDDASNGILRRLAEEGFLVLTPEGQYVRRSTGR